MENRIYEIQSMKKVSKRRISNNKIKENINHLHHWKKHKDMILHSQRMNK